jgi:DNA primase
MLNILKFIKPNIKITFVETPEGEDINSLSSVMKKKYLLTYSKPGKKSPFYFHLKEKTEKKKSKDPPSEPFSPLNRSTHHNPNKITYATSTAQYQILGGLRKDLDSMRVSLTIRNHNNNLSHRSKPDLFEDKQVEKIARESSRKAWTESRPDRDRPERAHRQAGSVSGK